MRPIVFLLSLITVATCEPKFDAHLGAVYEFAQTVVIRNNGQKPVGHRVAGSLELEYLGSNWVRAQVKDLKSHVLVRKGSEENFFVRRSKLNALTNDPFIFNWNPGQIETIYFSDQEDSSVVELKTGLARALHIKVESPGEIDGCVTSSQVKPNEISVEKFDCHVNPDVRTKVWGYNLRSILKKTLGLNRNVVEYSSGVETYELRPNLFSKASVSLSSDIFVNCTDSSVNGPYSAQVDENGVVDKVEKQFNIKLVKKSVDSVPIVRVPSKSRYSFAGVVHEYRAALKDKTLGTSESALALLKCTEAAQSASFEEAYAVLTSKKNKKIVPQLLDILGAVQTNETHQAAVRLLKLNGESIELDWCERYFWALSMSPNPRLNIIEELLQLVQTKHPNEKLWETLVLTLPALVRRHDFIHQTKSEEKIENTIRFLNDNLKECKDDIECQLIYLRGFVNLQEPKTLPALLEIISTSKGRPSVEALKAVQKLKVHDDQVIRVCLQVFLVNATYDSSARTIALDIILESRPNDTVLSTVLSILGQSDSPRELKQYLLQRLEEISEKCERFKSFIKDEFKSRGYSNNYNVLAQGGLSTSFSRPFIGGSLSTTQEVLGGILKRGNVHVNLEYNKTLDTVFTLGLFSSGLGGFMSSSSDDTEESDLVIAGMQLTVMDVELRPFVFFNGHGELMGHVFSGTASSLTPAYHALLLLEDASLSIPLMTGSAARLEFKTGASVALSGKIEISLWNKNAQSLVQNKASLATNGRISVTNAFVSSQGEFNLSIDPELHLSSDIEFYGKVALCLRLQQPDTTIKIQSQSRENLVGLKQSVTKTRSSTLRVPGKTYALNSKNNEMCSTLQLGQENS